MNLLHRHIFWSVLTTCLASVGLFASVLILGNALKDMIGFAMAGQIGLDTFGYLMALLVPYVAAYALPMGVLLGVLLVLGRLSAQHEITAMRAAGMSLTYISRPVLILGVLAAGLTLVVNFEFMPRARMAYKKILADAVQENPLSFIVPKTFVRDFPNIVLYVDEKEGAILRDVWFWRLDKEDRVREFGRAQSGELHFDEENASLEIVLRGVSAEARNEKDPEDFSKMTGTTSIGELPLSFRVDDLFSKGKARQKFAWMTFSELMLEKERFRAEGDEAKLLSASIAISEKGASALAVLAFALMAIPLGVRVSRKETSANLGVALILVMGYYFLTVIVSWLEAKPELRPDLLMWLPAVLFLGIGGWLFARLDRA
jgi:lipopolysaccharide export system permease protein